MSFSSKDFKSAGLSKAMLDNLKSLGYLEMIIELLLTLTVCSL